MLDLPSLGLSANERRSQKASRTIAKPDDSGSWQSSQCPQVPPTSGELAITERRVHSAATLDLDEVPLFWRPRPRGVFLLAGARQKRTMGTDRSELGSREDNDRPERRLATNGNREQTAGERAAWVPACAAMAPRAASVFIVLIGVMYGGVVDVHNQTHVTAERGAA
ncbi:hypothetical protein CGCA056_v003916 [Colletotrichum aenigma]|uniref:uncharacterized protein n=1 Tax=Colletotrichum aenigma TaxID=1215731 RepID=UPI0018732C26|nr:uncharacterized protein CGCA056_v003916 [Colletotrichum aenigma]KAF5525745.1 hypothetical protein CGCA056_v003916 [Colletotrichum aenigma]